ncbi:hypothetical protein M3484_18020 [Pseudomonas sp. GX19020]|uniref:ATP-binding protein n=1 Tax=Pseudomonas sp. GX19020 TaxID=2942277 RepID=UPI00201A0C65|nr:ATP-binding protein [Pseudomonas sp. GX19020]MCL4068467.1 hypothetical protein [Pseudomonas sp. GX19020]
MARSAIHSVVQPALIPAGARASRDEDDRARWLADLAGPDQIADSAIRLLREEGGGDLTEPLRLGRMPEDIALEMGGFGQKMVLVGMVAVTVRLQAIKRVRRDRMINAVPHGGGTASLGPGSGMVAVSFQNRGSGISESLMAGGIEALFRVDPGRQKVQRGSGPGLAIAREVLAHFGGALAIRTRRGGGLQHEITLPTLIAWPRHNSRFARPVCEGAGFHRAAFGKS